MRPAYDTYMYLITLGSRDLIGGGNAHVQHMRYLDPIGETSHPIRADYATITTFILRFRRAPIPCLHYANSDWNGYQRDRWLSAAGV